MSGKRKILCCILLFTSLVKVSAQVNIQTGSATFSLPIFQWQDDKSRLGNSVSLNYNSGSGLKTNEVASNIGQGWSLMGGGMITRIQVGEPDDQKPRNGAVNDITKYPAGYLYNTADISAGCPNALSKYPLFESSNTLYRQHNEVVADRELDFFAFQFMGLAGTFVLNKATGTGEALNDSKIKIWFEHTPNMTYQGKGIRTTISVFYIQSDNGLIYKFQQAGLTKVLKNSYTDPNRTAALAQPKLEATNVYFESGFEDNNIVNPYVINSWSLSEIKDPLTNRVITFNYTLRNISSSGGTDIAYYKESDYSIVTYKTGINVTPVLTSIGFPDGHVVNFNFQTKNRFDLAGDNALSSIDVQYNGRAISKYLLNNTYVISKRYGTPVTDAQKKVARLYLRSVKKIGPDLKGDEPPYLFDYFLGSDAADDVVPAPFSPFKDIWGYYNGANSKGSDGVAIPLEKSLGELNHVQVRGLCFAKDGVDDINLNPKAGYAKNGLLKMITYPTGGFITYAYEQNNGILNGSPATIGGVHVSKTSTVDGGYSNNCDSALVTNYQYVTSTGASSLWGIEMPRNLISASNNYIPEDKRIHVKWTSLIPDIICEYKYMYPGILSKDQATKIEVSDLMKAFSIVVGLYTAYSDANTLLLFSTGPVSAAIQILLKWAISLLSTCLGEPGKLLNSSIYFNADLNGANPLPSQFKRVEVIQGDGSKGKVVSEFTSNDDYDIWSTSNPNLSMAQRYPSWAYGLPKVTTVYNDAGIKVKETLFKYDPSVVQQPVFGPGTIGHSPMTYLNRKESIDENHTTEENAYPGAISNTPSCKCIVKINHSQKSTDWAILPSGTSDYTNQSTDEITVETYDIYKGRLPLLETDERVYKPGSSVDYLETRTQYDYNYYNYQVNNITVTQSNGDVTRKRIDYNIDFTGAPFSVWRDNNILSVPVAITESIAKAATPYTFNGLVKTVTEFKTGTGIDIKPIRTLVARTSSPQSTEFWAPYYGPGNSNNYTGFKITQSFSYDASLNLTGVKDEGGHSVTNVYGYNDKYVTASVINADSETDDVASTSFESDTYGGWTLSNANAISSAKAITGQRSLQLSGSNLSAPLNPAKAYTVSFWATSPVTVSGGTLVKSAPQINTFTYYEYTTTAGASSVTISGNAYLDELRVYPLGSRMRTVTYDPVIGKTSECDENNRIRYFEYDELGRIRFIKDEYGNIVKMYEYNYLDRKQNGCSGLFYNNGITEYFTKDCAAGYLGSRVAYTIQPRTYFSTVSQDDADQQAENELNIYGQLRSNADPAGVCALIYSSKAVAMPFTRNDCGVGYAGTVTTYVVAAGAYTSTAGQQYADQLAENEALANGQVNANTSPTSGCVINRDPYYVTLGEEICEETQYGFSGHRLIKVQNINTNTIPYSSDWIWMDKGKDYATCPPTYFTNLAMSRTLSNNTCLAGGVPGSATYEVPAKKHISHVNDDDAAAMALHDLDVNAQNYVNAHSFCVYSSDAVDIPFTKTCPPRGEGSVVSSIVNAGAYTSIYSIEDATNKAKAEANAKGQAHADQVGGCLYWNLAAYASAAKNDCTGGHNPTGTTVQFMIAAHTVSSNIDPYTADAQAQQQAYNGAQANANIYGGCVNHFWNEAHSKTYTPVCTEGGSPVSKTFSIGANVYESTENQEAADALAFANLDAAGADYLQHQAYCNYPNQARAFPFTKNCPYGSETTPVYYYVSEGAHISRVSRADANVMAEADAAANGPAKANQEGICLFYSTAQSVTYTKNDCPGPYNPSGTPVSYPLPERSAYSTESVEKANEIARNNASQAAQNHANQYGSCIYHYPNEYRDRTVTANCTVGGTGNSKYIWVDAEAYYSTESIAAANAKAEANLDYAAALFQQNEAICTYKSEVKNVPVSRYCDNGGEPETVYYYLDYGRFISHVSLADANAMAQADVDANAQNWANANGGCRWYNVGRTIYATKTNCSGNQTGLSVPYQILAGMTYSSINQADADTKAYNIAYPLAQDNANSTPSSTGCSEIFDNVYMERYVTANCPTGQTPNSKLVWVGAAAYHSTIDQADADRQARENLDIGEALFRQNEATCTVPPPPPSTGPYAWLDIEIVMAYPDGSVIGDVWLELYADQALSTPATLASSSLTVTYQRESPCFGNIAQFDKILTTWRVRLAIGAPCPYSFILVPGAGYIVVP